MKTIAISKTTLLKTYLEQSKFIQFETFGDCYIIHTRNDQQIFWFGVGYGEFCAKNK